MVTVCSDQLPRNLVFVYANMLWAHSNKLSFSCFANPTGKLVFFNKANQENMQNTFLQKVYVRTFFKIFPKCQTDQQ